MTKNLTLENKLDVFNLVENEKKLEEALDCDEVYIDLSNIERCDYNGIQMLLCFVKSASQNGHSVYIEKPSNLFSRAIETLGLANEFNIVDEHHD